MENEEMSELLLTIDSLCSLEQKEETSKLLDDKSGEEGYSKGWLEHLGFREEQIDEIQKGVSQSLDVSHYAKDCYNWMQMREIRLGLLEKVQTEWYENPLFMADQMREIRMGLIEGLGVFSYAKLLFTTSDMARERRKLLQTKYSINPKGFAWESVDEESGIKIRVSDDCMKAYITLPESGNFTTGEIKKILARHDIIFGLMNRQLQNIVNRKYYGKEVQIAQGEKAHKGSDGRYEFFFNPLLPGGPKELKDGSVDYTEVVEADRMSAGDLLAKYYPAEAGKNGRTVTGICIPGMKGKELLPLVGKGFIRKPEVETYTATINGFVVADEQKGTMNVWNVFHVEGDVNRYNGHISYDGIIHIKGCVGDLAVIEASGNIVVDGLVGNAQLIAGENVILKGGAKGGGSGFIRAGGKVMGKFFESIAIYAGGDVEGNYFMNCRTETDGKLIAKGSKGRILGGNLRALCGIEAMVVGNYSSIKTIIDVANPMQTESRRKQLITEMSKVEDELYQLIEGKDKLSRLLGEEIAKSNQIFQKTCLAVTIKEEQKKELEEKIEYLERLKGRSNRAYIRIFGSLQEGVVVMMNGKVKEIQKTNKGIRIVNTQT